MHKIVHMGGKMLPIGQKLEADSLSTVLSQSPTYKDFVERNPFFNYVDKAKSVTREQVVVVLGQWLHPLHRFPDFLADLVRIAPDLTVKSHVAQILSEELGEGDPVCAHENLYRATMIGAGFSPDSLESPPTESTC